MCVIYVCNSVIPSDEELSRGATRNDDGAGISWLAPNKKKPNELIVQWQKGLKDDKEVRKFIEDNKIPMPLIIHFRTASVGGTIKGLTHPFPTSPNAELWEAGTAAEVLFHNGHLSNWESLLLEVGFPSTERFPTGPWSDTRALAWITYLKGPGILDFIIKSSRVALMHSDSNSDDESYDKAENHITLYGSGWIHKVGYSQSIGTDPVNWVTPGRNYSQYMNSMDDDDTEADTSAGKCMVGTPNVKLLTPITSSSTDLNIWTIEELLSLIAQFEEQQSHAKLAAGV